MSLESFLSVYFIVSALMMSVGIGVASIRALLWQFADHPLDITVPFSVGLIGAIMYHAPPLFFDMYRYLFN